MRKLSILLAIAFALSGPAKADFAIPGFELVYTTPAETTLSNPDLRDPVTVWCEMLDAAKTDIDIAQFYVAGKTGEALDKVIAHLAAAGERGVKIRFLMEEKGKSASEMKSIERLKNIPHLDFRFMEFGKLRGQGIIHAKYMVVDKAIAYVGSQNFDWRSLSHIHETGLRINDVAMVRQLHSIFDIDWQAQALLTEGKAVPALNQSVVLADQSQSAYLVASPNAFNPPGIGDSESELVRLLAAATSEVRITLLDYVPLSYAPGRKRPYYAVIDNAIRAALARGVRVRLMVSNWNTEEPAIHHLKSLALLPGMEIRIVNLPQASSGFIPFARVIHSKTMSIDGKLAWIGTSNWSGGYLDNSRNLEIVLRNEAMAKRLADLHEQTWQSPYAQPLEIQKNYPKPVKG
ncbi:phospholipase [Undibacterium sp. CY18W]|uniref:Phospholipase n=1 Tax=Undibacterium hunanense TaxID=2762292 RepID=A0ABR6ZTW2_9BURK|nr:phospholipase D-like domain-containing protein [Undibacterium hunanense]MBC3919310.1 phospholipase [Undibacterium hunanense]